MKPKTMKIFKLTAVIFVYFFFFAYIVVVLLGNFLRDLVLESIRYFKNTNI